MLKLNAGGEGGDMNVILGLISNMEKKLNGKNKLLEEKISKVDGNCFKMTKDLQNLKNTQDLNKRQFETIKKQIEDLLSREETLNKVVEVNNEEINDKLDSKITYLERYIKESLEVLNKGINKKLNTLDENISIGKEAPKETTVSDEIQNINIEDNKVIRGLKDTISDINKKIKSLANQSDIEQIRIDISSLKGGMNNSVRLTDFKELKELEDENRNNIRKLKEDLEDLQNNQTESGEFIMIKKKLEVLTNKIHDMEENDYFSSKKLLNTSKAEEKNRFIDFKIFNEFKSQIVKEFNNINENFINSRKLLDELIDSVRNRTSFKDLKALEDAVMSKMEDLKISSGKKFADRNEVNRTIKYLDQQIRNIVQVYIKKIEKGDNWLLAKKPITNNLCASCESYLGDLKDSNSGNNIYIPWNKYPVKDPNDKLYRMGHGFSKMLQMIQVDENDKKSAFQSYNELNEISKNKNTLTKTDFFNGSGIDGSDLSPHSKNMKNFNNLTINNMNKTTQKSLPKLKKHKLKKKNPNMTADSEQNLNNPDDSEENEDEPKITKIFRMNKDQH
jgi:chromosome segregation ATPase